MAAEEATMAVKAEEGTEEAIDDKDKSSHRSIDGNNNDEGSNNDSSEDSGEILAAAPCVAVAGKF